MWSPAVIVRLFSRREIAIGSAPFFFLSLLNVSGAWCEDGQSLGREGVEGGEASDVAGGGGKKVKEEEMEKEKKEEAIGEE